MNFNWDKQTGNIPKHLEEAFVKVSFEELSDVKPTSGDADPSYVNWIDNASAKRAATEIWSVDMFKKAHPNHSLVVAEAGNANLLGYPHLLIEPVNPDELVATTLFLSLPRRSSSVPGVLVSSISFGAFRIAWDKYDFLVYFARVPIPAQFRVVTFQYILHEGTTKPAGELLTVAGIWQNQLHNEILVFNQGFWSKDRELWEELQKADWKDVILEEERKNALHRDIYGFFKSEHVYKELAIPWKRGIIMHGPPGNGKTISIKAIMKECDSKGFAPLYVKSFKSWMGEEASMQAVFDKAREMSPCVVIFEDLDSLITDQNRSFFLNQLDGFESNDGLLCIGTTNHFDRLDPALKTRPSRFDRKYLFDDPNRDERVLYAKYWQNKLKSNHDIAFPDSLVEEIADATTKFSFAYLKEAFVSTLFLLATSEDADKGSFAHTLKKIIKDLREQLDKAPAEVAFVASRPTMSVRSETLPPKPERDINALARAATAIGRSFIY